MHIFRRLLVSGQSLAQNLNKTDAPKAVNELDTKKVQEPAQASTDAPATDAPAIPKESIGDQAKGIASKALSITAKVATTVTVVSAAGLAGMLIVSYLNMGVLTGLAIMAGVSLILSYVDLGVSHGIWNPIAFLQA